MQSVVLAGGLATRMRPLTITTPKSMLEVAGRPFVEWQLEKLAHDGFDDVVMCIAHLGEQIEAHVGDGSRFGLRVRYAHEGDKLLGTAGAIRAAYDLLAPTFLVTYGDSYLPFDYASPLRALDAHSDCDGVMSAFKNDGKWDASNVTTDGEWITRYEKGTTASEFDHIDYGAIALRRDVIPAYTWPLGSNEARPVQLDAMQRDLASKRRLRAIVAKARFFEIGSKEGLSALDQQLRNG